MAIYEYSNQDTKGEKNEEFFELKEWDFVENIDNKANIWNFGKFIFDYLDMLARSSKLANLAIPAVFILIGSFFIGRHFFPDIQYKIKEERGVLAQETVSPVAESFVTTPSYISNPRGLESLTKSALDANILQKDDFSLNYDKEFTISIPTLGFDKLLVEPNVDSSSEDAYMAALEDSLAHFRYTGLPNSPVENNIVIYGHSASPNYNPKRSDPMVAFSYLQELKIGDDIYIEMEGQTYHFKMQKSKIVEPTEVSIITGTPGKRTLTLFTCTPPGNNSHRYVVIAREV